MVYVDVELCKSCRICKENCPKDVFDFSGHVNKKGYNYAQAARVGDCIACGLCERLCPDFAIHVEKGS